MAKIRCIDPPVGDILSGWRYDISGLHSEMRLDYEEHLRECVACHSRQRLHRTIDVLLIAGASLAIVAFVLALLVLHHIEPLRDWVIFDVRIHRMSLVISLQLLAVFGLLVSLAAWVLVAVITPAPVYISQQARALQARLPEELRGHLPKLSA